MKQVTSNIALSPHFDRFVQAKVESGRYQSASEVVRESLRLLEERDEQREGPPGQLRRDIEIGWLQFEKSDIVDAESVFSEIRKMSKARRARAKASR